MTMAEISNRRQQSLLGGGEARIAAQHQKVHYLPTIPIPISECLGKIDGKRALGDIAGQEHLQRS